MKNIKNTNLMLAVILVILAVAGGFVGGMQYQKNQRPSFDQFANRAGAGANFQGRLGNSQGARPVTGQIVSVSDNSMTVKMQDGSTKIVILSSSTSINKAAQGSKSDLKTGETVAAFGTANSDGSITAQSVQLNPVMRGFSGGRPQQSP